MWSILSQTQVAPVLGSAHFTAGPGSPDGATPADGLTSILDGPAGMAPLVLVIKIR